MKVRSLIVGFALGIGLIGAATLASNAQNAPNANATQQKIYISLENLEKDNLAVIDLATFKEIKRLTVGSHPHGLTSPRSQSVLYAASELGGVVTLVDTVRDQVIKTFHVGFGVEPQNGAVTPDGRLLYQPSYAGYWQVFDMQKEGGSERRPACARRLRRGAEAVARLVEPARRDPGAFVSRRDASPHGAPR